MKLQHISWSGFFPMVQWTSDSEMYLSMVSSETQVQAQANFTFSALEYSTCMFVAGCEHPSLQTWSYRCPMFKVLFFKLHHKLACGFSLPSGMEWGWSFLALISNKFWTTTRSNFLWSTCYCRSTMIQLFTTFRFKRWKNNIFCPLSCSLNNFITYEPFCLSLCQHSTCADCSNSDRFQGFPTFITKAAFC